jgi:hypothetical protein
MIHAAENFPVDSKISTTIDPKFAELVLKDISRLKIFFPALQKSKAIQFSENIFKAMQTSNNRSLESIGIEKVQQICDAIRKWQGQRFIPALEGGVLTNRSCNKNDLQLIMEAFGYSSSGVTQIKALTKSLAAFKPEKIRKENPGIDPERLKMEMDCVLKMMLCLNDPDCRQTQRSGMKRAASILEAFNQLKEILERVCP